MTYFREFPSKRILTSKYFTLLAIVLICCLTISCTDDDPEVIVEPDTYIYLVTLNEDPELQSLTIIDSLNGTGSMVVPDIPAHLSSRFELVIDRVDDSRANISASQPNSPGISDVTGAGFFTADSVYVELIINGFTNRDILSGNR